MPARNKTATSPPKDPLDIPGISESLRALARKGVVRSYRKGTVLIDEGDTGNTIYIILAGRLRVFSSGERGREITFGTYGPGEYVGEMSLDGGARSASVATLEPCTCAIVTRATLEGHIAEQPKFAFELIGKVIRRARAATLSTRQLALNDVYGRLVALIDRSAVEMPDGTRVVAERLTHQDAANRLGCSREMVSRLLKDLVQGGHLRVQPTGEWVVAGRLPAKW